MWKRLWNRLRSGIEYIKRNIFSGITRRWFVNIFGVILLMSVLTVTLFCIFARNSYYANVSERLRNDATSVERYYDNYVRQSYSSFSLAAQHLVENFEDRDIIEIQVSDPYGWMTLSSSGFAVTEQLATPDLVAARDGQTQTWIGKVAGEGDKIMSLSLPLYGEDHEIVGTVRMMTTMKYVDKALLQLYLIASALGLGVIMITVFSGIYFIKSIVIPVNLISNTAREISKGNMTARVESFENKDELGALCDTINMMVGQLSENEKLKNDFISSVSHELRTPLTAIRGWSETMLAGEEEQDEITRKGLSVIYKETERLSRLVEELLDTTRIQNGRFKLVVEEIDVVAEFEETIFMMMERARQDGVQIEYEPFVISANIRGDKNRLKQVFFNIVDNAIKHSEKEDIIQTSVEIEEGKVKCIVEDHGEGISKEDLPFIREMFYKGHSNKRGSGIGLGISDEIVKRHGGEMLIESELGVGTKVTILLPILQSDEEEL